MPVFTAVLVTAPELSQDDLLASLERLGIVAFLGPGSLVQDCDPECLPAAGEFHEDPVEREVRLDEARIADEMERESVRGISPPDY